MAAVGGGVGVAGDGASIRVRRDAELHTRDACAPQTGSEGVARIEKAVTRWDGAEKASAGENE